MKTCHLRKPHNRTAPKPRAQSAAAFECSEWVAELEAARRCIMRWEATRDKPLTECDAHRAGKVMKLLERMIELERCRSATVRISDPAP